MNFSVEAVDVTKSFGPSKAVDGVSLQVPEGSIYGLVGSNGAGKTSLLRMFIGTLWPDTGEVRLLGEKVPREAAQLRQYVHYVSPEMEFFRSFTVKELLHYTGLLYRRFDESRCQRLLEVLELPHSRRIRELSTGMTMQLRLLVALAARPDVLLLDEPTTGLDPVIKRQFLQLILQEAAGYGTTVVMATHQLPDIERMVDHVAFMYRGRLVLAGDLDTLRGRLLKVQANLPQGLPPWLAGNPHLVHSEQSGHLYTLVLSESQDVPDRLRREGADYVETVNLDLDEMFQYVMEQEGYVRSGILLS